MKKLLSIVLTLAMLLSFGVVSVAAEDAAPATALEVSVGAANVDGTTVTVPVVVDSNTGFQAMTVTVGYNSDVLALNSADKATDFTTAEDSAVVGPVANPVTLQWAYALSTENVTATGTIATLTFTVLDDTVESTDIDLTVTEAWDVAGNEVTATATDGTVDLKEEPECEHDWEYVTAIPAEGTTSSAGLANTTTTKTGSITLKCSVCGAEETEDVQYYGRTKCFTANAVYESAIQLEFSARKDRLVEAGQYGDAFVRFEHVLPDGSVKETAQKVADGKDTVKNTRDSKTWAYSVKAMQLTENIDTYVFVEIDGVWYSGEKYGYSVRSYADTILPYTTVDTTEKALIVNMLRYGSKMQTYKNYNTENLADADIPAEYAALITETDPVIEGTYSRDENIGNDCLQIITTYTLFMDSRTEVRLRARSDRFTADPAKDDFVIEANWTSAKGSTETRSAKYYNVAYATDDQLTYTQDSQSANAGRWEFYFGECPAYDFRQVVTFKLYDPADPETDLGNSFSASFEQLISNGISSGTYKGAELDMYKAMMNYSDAARAHFCK